MLDQGNGNLIPTGTRAELLDLTSWVAAAAAASLAPSISAW
jgi:hypothetical protein